MSLSVDRPRGTSPLDISVYPDSKELSIWVVPHTHWDREWYLPFEQFRIHLARLMDDLLDALEQNPSLVFTLDGQAILIEDYLEIRPEQEARLRRLIAKGRIAIGPSYVLPDEFLTGQESLIRNLLIGRQSCIRYGGTPMAAGYAPDTFGHVSQLPQILKGFGIDSFIFWRGLGDEIDRLGALFWWQAPDGSRVLAVRLLESYANGRDLGRWTKRDGWMLDNPELWPDMAASRISEFLDRWKPILQRTGLRHILLGNGVDHQPIQRDLLDMLDACKRRFPDVSFRIGTYTDYVDAVRDDPGLLETFSGELVGGREACVVRGVNSTRIYLKQANEATERSVLTAETLASFAYLKAIADQTINNNHSAKGSVISYRYPRNELRLAWRELLRNQPHDSLPGCSLDDVHIDMQQRFRAAQQIAEQVQRDALAFLAGRTAPIKPWEDNIEKCSLINTLPWSRRAAIELPLPPDLQSAGSLVAETAHGSLPVQLFGPPGRRRAIVVIELPGFGAKKVRLRPGKAFVPASSAASADHRAIENEFYRIEVAPNGTIDVLDRITGQRWSGAHWFQDEGDRGDEYSFCPVEGDTPFDSRSCEAVVRVKARGPHVAELEISSKLHLPKKLAATRRNRIKTKVCIPVKTIVRLIAGVNRIEFTTTVLNRARDHRLRVFFPSPGSGLTVQAEGHFAVLRRPAQPVWNGQWREPPAKTHHTLGGVAAGKLALFGIGLPEYEAVPNDAGGVDLALTLLRSVGWLGCSDLSTRPGAQEPHIPTPGAQCLGSHSFSYAVALRESWAEVDLIRASQDFRFGFAVGPGIVEPAELLSVEGDGFATSALKGAEDGNGAILRIYNPGAFPTVASVHGRGLSFMRCRLDETNTSQDETGVVALRPGEIVTLRVTSKQAAGIRHEAQGSRTQHSALNTRDGALNTQGDYNGR